MLSSKDTNDNDDIELESQPKPHDVAQARDINTWQCKFIATAWEYTARIP